MPGSMTISHTDALVMLSHADAERLATVLGEMSALTAPGPDGLTDAQVAKIGRGAVQRAELAEWSAKLSKYLTEHL